MDYRLRSHATKILQKQAEILAELEAMIEEMGASAEVGSRQLVKLQADHVHWQDRFTRLAYLSGEVSNE